MNVYVYLKPPHNEAHDFVALEGTMTEESTNVAMVLEDTDGDTWVIPWSSIEVMKVVKE